MLDRFREHPRPVLLEMIAARQERNPAYRPPLILHALTWMFLDDPLNRVLGKIALRLLKRVPDSSSRPAVNGALSPCVVLSSAAARAFCCSPARSGDSIFGKSIRP